MAFRSFVSKHVCMVDPTPTQYPFLLIGGARSGTGFFRGLVDNHPKATCAGELLHPFDNKLRERLHKQFVSSDGQWLEYQGDGRQRKKQSIAYLEKQVFPLSANNLFGFKVLYYQLEQLGLYKYFEKKKNKKLHVVRNPIAVYVSHEQAKMTQSWVASTENEIVKAGPIEINHLALTGFIDDYLSQRDKVNNLSAPLLQIEYQTLVRKTHETMTQVFEFLEVPYIETVPVLKKQQDWDVRSRITNFDEMSKNIADRHECFLEDIF